MFNIGRAPVRANESRCFFRSHKKSYKNAIICDFLVDKLFLNAEAKIKYTSLSPGDNPYNFRLFKADTESSRLIIVFTPTKTKQIKNVRFIRPPICIINSHTHVHRTQSFFRHSFSLHSHNHSVLQVSCHKTKFCFARRQKSNFIWDFVLLRNYLLQCRFVEHRNYVAKGRILKMVKMDLRPELISVYCPAYCRIVKILFTAEFNFF